MNSLTDQQIEDLACKHHWYACGRAPGQEVVAEHCFEATGLLAFVREVERKTKEAHLRACRTLCTSPQTLFDDGYNAALSDFEDELKTPSDASSSG